MRLRCCWNARGWKMAVLIIFRVWKQIGHLTARLIFLLWLFRLLFCACSNPRVNQVPSLLHPLVFQHNLQVLLAVTLKHRVPDALSARRLHKNAVHAAPSGDSIRSNSRLQTQQIGAVQHGDHAVALQEEGSQGLEVWSSKKNKEKRLCMLDFSAVCWVCKSAMSSLHFFMDSSMLAISLWGFMTMWIADYLQFLQFLEFLRMMRFEFSDLGFLCRFFFVAFHDFLPYFLEVLKNNTTHSLLITSNHTAHSQPFHPQ